MARPTVFISYSHKDEEEKEQLLSHLGVLQNAGLIDLWSDDRIGAGAEWEAEIGQAIGQAGVAILLISANFLTSEFISSQEVPALLQRRKREGLTVVPVIAKACAWRTVDWLARMNVRPKNGRPVWTGSPSLVDERLAAIAEEIASIIKKLQKTQSKPLPPPPAYADTFSPLPERSTRRLPLIWILGAIILLFILLIICCIFSPETLLDLIDSLS